MHMGMQQAITRQVKRGSIPFRLRDYYNPKLISFLNSEVTMFLNFSGNINAVNSLHHCRIWNSKNVCSIWTSHAERHTIIHQVKLSVGRFRPHVYMNLPTPPTFKLLIKGVHHAQNHQTGFKILVCTIEFLLCFL